MPGTQQLSIPLLTWTYAESAMCYSTQALSSQGLRTSYPVQCRTAGMLTLRYNGGFMGAKPLEPITASMAQWLQTCTEGLHAAPVLTWQNS